MSLLRRILTATTGQLRTATTGQLRTATTGQLRTATTGQLRAELTGRPALLLTCSSTASTSSPSSRTIQQPNALFQQPSRQLHSTRPLAHIRHCNLPRTNPVLQAGELTRENLPEARGCSICSRGIKYSWRDILFISQFIGANGKMLPKNKTGICSQQYVTMMKTIHKARRLGLIPREYPTNGEPAPAPALESISKLEVTYFDPGDEWDGAGRISRKKGLKQAV